MAEDKLPDLMLSLKAADRERWLTLLFADEAQRRALAALYGVNAEIAKVAETVSEPLLGRIRLQWWRDSLAAAESGAGGAGGPLALEVLAPYLAEGRLAAADFAPLLAAREAELEEDGPADWSGLDAHAEATGGSLARMALRLLAPDAQQPLRDRAAALGRGWALTGLLRTIPHRAARRRSVLPLAALEEAGLGLADLTEGRVVAGAAAEAFRGLVAALAVRAAAALDAAAGAVPRPARPLFLQQALARRHLRHAARLGHQAFDARLAETDPLAAWRLSAAALRLRLTGRLW